MIDSGVTILDVTLRDGSYLIDFQFSQQDTSLICKALESAGIEWIEIGHGVGLGASEKNYGVAAATDKEYLIAASENLERAKWGMFFIPGIGTEDHLRMAADYKMPFVRIGTNITEAETAIPYIELAKKLGFFVAYNGMKSYAVPPKMFAEKAKIVYDSGVDMVCLVDSAGGFYPDDVKAYFNATQELSKVPLGFHGHDNLSLAMANTLMAIDCGAIMVDSSLQGMGRSAGNAVTEVLVAILKQKGIITKIDLNALIDIGQNIIQPMITNKGMDPLAIISGYARFHSSFTSKVTSYAKKYNLDVRDLIVKLCEFDKVNAPEELLEQLSSELAGQKINVSKQFIISSKGFTASKKDDTIAKVDQILKEIKSKAIKYGKFSALNLVFDHDDREEIVVSNNLYSSATHIIGSVTISKEEVYEKLIKSIEGKTDILFLDADIPAQFRNIPLEAAKNNLDKTLVLTYSDTRIWANAVEEQCVRLLDENVYGKNLVIIGDNTKSRLLASGLLLRKANVYIVDLEKDEIDNTALNADSGIHLAGKRQALDLLQNFQPDVVICWSAFDEYIQLVSDRHKTIFLDAEIGSVSGDMLEKIISKSSDVIRVNIWPVLSGWLNAIHESYNVTKNQIGRAQIAGVPVVSGGAIGFNGDVIVDSYNDPTYIIGIADGKGHVIFDFDDEMAKKITVLQNAINKKLISA